MVDRMLPTLPAKASQYAEVDTGTRVDASSETTESPWSKDYHFIAPPAECATEWPDPQGSGPHAPPAAVGPQDKWRCSTGRTRCRSTLVSGAGKGQELAFIFQGGGT